MYVGINTISCLYRGTVVWLNTHIELTTKSHTHTHTHTLTHFSFGCYFQMLQWDKQREREMKEMSEKGMQKESETLKAFKEKLRFMI